MADEGYSFDRGLSVYVSISKQDNKKMWVRFHEMRATVRIGEELPNFGMLYI